jgi:hypothetical protein
MQNIRSSTLNHLKQHEKETYLMLCSTLLNKTKNKLPTYEDSTLKHLAKQIRNRYYNKRNIKQTGYKKKM